MQFQYERRSQHNAQRQIIKKLQPSSKILISIIVAVVGFILTHGQPKKATLLQGIDYIDTTVQQIFETTIAVEKKRFIKRIVSQTEGYWGYIPYVNQDKWADLQITLTTRIGFDIKNTDQVIAGVTAEGKIRVDVFQPTVLSKNWHTNIIATSDNLFSKWNIKQFKKKQVELLQILATQESLIILDNFRNDPSKMSELAYRLDQRLMMKKSNKYSPLYWLNNVNKMITNQLSQFSNSFTYSSNNSHSYQKDYSQKKQDLKQSHRSKETTGSKNAKTGQNVKSNRKFSAYKQVLLSEQEDRIRRQMKNHLNL